MNAPPPKFEQTATFDEIEADEAQLNARRLQLYSKHALKVGLPVDRIYINHPRFDTGLKTLDRVFQIAPEVTMPHGVRLIGPTGSGKSALFRYFRDSLPRSSLFTEGLGAIGIRFGPKPTAGQLVAALLRAYRYPFSYGSGKTVYAKCDIVYDLIREKGTRLLFVDEAHRLLNQVRRNERNGAEPDATNVLRDLIDECKIAVVLAGTDLLDGLDKVDTHLLDRVPVRHELRYFNPDSQWMGILRAFVKQCQTFDLAIISDTSEAKLLHMVTGGSLRRLKRLLTEAVLIAADAGKTALDRESIALAVALTNGYDSLLANPYA